METGKKATKNQRWTVCSTHALAVPQHTMGCQQDKWRAKRMHGLLTGLLGWSVEAVVMGCVSPGGSPIPGSTFPAAAAPGRDPAWLAGVLSTDEACPC
jgi:hypothetical protein